MGLYHDEPEAAHAASEINDDRESETTAPFFHGLLCALGLTAAALIIAHLLARYVL